MGRVKSPVPFFPAKEETVFTTENNPSIDRLSPKVNGLRLYVYLLTNTINGKRYVGQTSARIAYRWGNHKAAARKGADTYLCRAIRKYGESAFSVSVLGRAESLEQLDALERCWIAELQTNNPLCGYNSTSGGDRPVVTEESRRKCGHGKGWAAGNSYALGYKHTQEAKQAIADAARGRKFSLSHRHKMSEANKKSDACYDVDVMRTLYESGASTQKIAEKLLCSSRTVWSYLKNSGVAFRPAGRPRVR